MTFFQVKAALDNAIYFLKLLSPDRLPPGPLSPRQENTVRNNLLRRNRPKRGEYPARFWFRAWQVSRIENFHEWHVADIALLDAIAAHKLGIKP